MKETQEFYDEFMNVQLHAGLHERHCLMHLKLYKLGLQEDSNLLEIGAGVGMITSQLIKTVKTGTIVVNDISPEQIAKNKHLNKAANLKFHVGDIFDLDENMKFDYITLFDVLEHIPIEQHDELFKMMTSLLSENGMIVINIPNPGYLEYMIEHEPESLQIIDQPLPADGILKHAYTHGLVLEQFENLTIWQKKDYQFFAFTLKKEWKPINVKNKHNIFTRIQNRLNFRK